MNFIFTVANHDITFSGVLAGPFLFLFGLLLLATGFREAFKIDNSETALLTKVTGFGWSAIFGYLGGIVTGNVAIVYLTSWGVL